MSEHLGVVCWMYRASDQVTRMRLRWMIKPLSNPLALSHDFEIMLIRIFELTNLINMYIFLVEFFC